ncbi:MULTISPECIES: hypothetical protein [unclassified Knoellia]|uniref:hypothetical protein n=1 Tax=Knoellia altitudinis TaxID=3404795 RepID=UPI00361E3F7E
MTSMILLVRATAAELQRPVIWARTRVRLVDSEQAGWTIADVGAPNQAALERVAEEVSAFGPALLLVVGELRTGVQLWHGGRRRARVGWTSGEVNALSAADAETMATLFASALGVDPGPVARALREATSPDRSFRALMSALAAPVPSHFGRHRSGPLDSERTTVVERHGIVEAMVEDHWGH